ncbi:MAG: Maf family protein [Anaerolineae bacterium]
MSETRLVLASQSPRRSQLLRLVGLPFKVAPAEVFEAPRSGESPVELVTRLSRAKVDGVRMRDRPGALVIGCDTIVSLNGRVLGKPRDPTAAAAMLRSLRGRSHLVHSAITCLGPQGRTATELVSTRVTMRGYSDAEIAAYVASGDPLDKAGGYAIQHTGFRPVDQVEGCYAGVMGLPLCHLTRCLTGWGVTAAADVPAACQAFTSHLCSAYQEIMTL